MNARPKSIRGRFPQLVLASASPRRQELLRQMGVDYETIPARVRELEDPHLSPRELCLLNAYRKARAVARRHPERVVLGADTLVFLGRQLFGKPATRAAAEGMLARLQGRTHQVITGVCLCCQRQRRTVLFAESTAVTFRRLDRAAIRRYLDAVNPLDKAGAYAIQEWGNLLIARIAGSRSNVVGLPVERLQEELEHWPR